MRTLVRGEILDLVPSFKGSIGQGGDLVISESGDFALTVDTGFSGGIALPEEILDGMEGDFFGYDTFTLATGEVVELPMYLGRVILRNRVIQTWFIPGDFLLGMEFLSAAGSLLSLHFREGIVRLSK